MYLEAMKIRASTMKLKCGNQEENSVDRISNLPTPVLQHILSFIDTKYAVRASILARGWRHTWVSLPTLRFNYSLFYNSNLSPEDNIIIFTNFVDQVFINRDGSNLTKVSPCYIGNYEKEEEKSLPHGLYAWVLASIRHNVEEVDLQVDTDSTLCLPPSLFTSKSLKVLKLNLGTYESPFELPNNIALPRVKDLYLASITFPNHRLLTKCPVLESLELYCCDPRIENLDISVPSLKHLKIIHFSSCGGIFKVNAPNLISFSVEGDICVDYSVESFPSLSNAMIDLYVVESEVMMYYSQQMLNILRAASEVKALTLRNKTMQVISQPRSGLESLSTPFLNLRYMHLHSRLLSDSIPAIMHLLKISPNIETLILEKIQFCCSWDKDKAILVSSENFGEIRKSMLHQLKYVEIQGVLGWVNELNFLEVLLSNSVVLEKMVIIGSPIIGGELSQFSRKVLSLPRASSNIEILFIKSP